jgi:hypothetical protein
MNNMNNMNHDHTHKEPEEPPHNMMVVGEKKVFLSHLPMFMTPHNFQVILEATFTSGGTNVQGAYSKDRQGHRQTKMYTLRPEESFKLPSLFTPNPPSRNSFKGTILRGHLERGGQEITGLTKIDINVKRVVYAQKFGRGFDKSDKLTYILFGSGQELFLAHVIARPPDFDQLLSVKINNPPSDEELSRGVRVTILDRENSASRRIKEKEKVVGQGHVTGAHQFLELQIQANVEFYFEEGELSSSKMTDDMFDPTPEERKAGFGS